MARPDRMVKPTQPASAPLSPSFRKAISTESAEPRSTAARSAAAKFSSFMRTRPGSGGLLLGVERRQQGVEPLDQRLGFRDGLFAVLNLLGQLVPFTPYRRELVSRAHQRRIVWRTVCQAGILSSP